MNKKPHQITLFRNKMHLKHQENMGNFINKLS